MADIYILYAVYYPEPGAPGSNEYVVLGAYTTLERAQAQRAGKWYQKEQGEWWQHYDAEGAFCIETQALDQPA